MSDQNLYVRLLAKFRDGWKDFADRFRAAQGDTDASAAMRAAHHAEGRRRNDRREGRAGRRARARDACREGAPAARIKELVSQTVAELGPGHRRARQDRRDGRTAAAASRSQAGVGRSGSVQGAADRLRVLLADNDADARRHRAGAAELAQGTALAPGVKKVASAVAEYDFESALQGAGRRRGS
jgi:hypothetical protein